MLHAREPLRGPTQGLYQLSRQPKRQIKAAHPIAVRLQTITLKALSDGKRSRAVSATRSPTSSPHASKMGLRGLGLLLKSQPSSRVMPTGC